MEPQNNFVPSATQPVSVPRMDPPQKNHHTVALILLVIILVVVGGATAFAEHLGFFNSPQTIIKNAILALDSTKTLHSDITVTGDYTLASGPQTVKIVANADVDKTDKTNPSVNAQISFTGLGFAGDMDIAVLAKTFYFKINQLPMLAMANIPIMGKWVSVTTDDVKKLSTLFGIASSSLSYMDATKTPTPDLTAIYAIVDKNNLLSNVTSQGISSQNGTYIRTYKIILDKNSLENTLIDISQMNQAQSGQNASATISADQIKKGMDTLFGSVDLDPVMVDIGLTDGMLHGVRMGAGLAPGTTTMSVANAHIEFDASYSNFGNTLNITAPTDSQSIVDVITAYMASMKAAQKSTPIKSTTKTTTTKK